MRANRPRPQVAEEKKTFYEKVAKQKKPKIKKPPTWKKTSWEEMPLLGSLAVS